MYTGQTYPDLAKATIDERLRRAPHTGSAAAPDCSRWSSTDAPGDHVGRAVTRAVDGAADADRTSASSRGGRSARCSPPSRMPGDPSRPPGPSAGSVPAMSEPADPRGRPATARSPP